MKIFFPYYNVAFNINTFDINIVRKKQASLFNFRELQQMAFWFEIFHKIDFGEKHILAKAKKKKKKKIHPR